MSTAQSHFSSLSNVPQESLDDLYFSIQAQLGITKHIGSTIATEKLIQYCHINEHSTVLDVGCGVGLTALYIAKNYGSRVVGVDIRPAMIETAKANARKQDLTDYVTFQVADACDLPQSDNVYDAVICESVLAFIVDHNQALQELTRVLKPKGYLGYTEAVWITSPPETDRHLMDQITGVGSGVQISDVWANLLSEAGLVNQVTEAHKLNIVSDSIHQMRHFGWSKLFSIWGKAIYLLLTDVKYRYLVRVSNTIPKSLMKHIGFGIYVGQAP